MSALAPQPGPAGPPQAGSPIPPALLAVLAQHQAGAAPQPPPEEQESGGDEREEIQILHQMIALATRYLQIEPDASDRATMAKLAATLHQYLAKEQSDAEEALGGGGATRLLRRLGT